MCLKQANIYKICSKHIFSRLRRAFVIARRAFVWDPFKFRCPYDVRPSGLRIFWEFYARRSALKTRFLDQSVQAKTSNSENPKIENDVSEVGDDTYFRFFYETGFKKFPSYVSMKICDLVELGSYRQCKIKTKSHFQKILQTRQIDAHTKI